MTMKSPIGMTFRDMGMPRDTYKDRHPDTDRHPDRQTDR